LVNGVQAKPLDAPRSGIRSGISAKAGPPAQAAMAAPATSPPHLARRASGLQMDFNTKKEIIVFPPQGGRSPARSLQSVNT
jgi:hypothetical protein